MFNIFIMFFYKPHITHIDPMHGVNTMIIISFNTLL